MELTISGITVVTFSTGNRYDVADEQGTILGSVHASGSRWYAYVSGVCVGGKQAKRRDAVERIVGTYLASLAV